MFLTMSEKLSSFLSCFTSCTVRGMRMVRGASHASTSLSTALTRIMECVRLSISLCVCGVCGVRGVCGVCSVCGVCGVCVVCAVCVV